jgi:hypothetical protein
MVNFGCGLGYDVKISENGSWALMSGGGDVRVGIERQD